MGLQFLLERVAEARRILWLLDYDGTLVPFSPRPELATPDLEILQLLKQLAADQGSEVHIISGRPREPLEEWLALLPIGIHAEHGLWSRDTKGEWGMNASIDTSWKESVGALLREFVRRTPGSLIERKTASIAWHYRMADAQVAERQARDLKILLANMLRGVAAEVLAGSKVVEIKATGIDKGIVAARLARDDDRALVVAIGDDETDEYMFRALPNEAMTICVGRRDGGAQYRLQDVAAVRELIRRSVALRSVNKYQDGLIR